MGLYFTGVFHTQTELNGFFFNINHRDKSTVFKKVQCVGFRGDILAKMVYNIPNYFH